MRNIFDEAYKQKNIVWTESEPPEELTKLIRGRKIKLCKVLDIACGEGYNSIYLASKGFDVLGVDISKRAVQYAKENAKKAGLKIRFKEINLKNIDNLNEKFDFILEWSVLHFLPFDKRKEYINKIYAILNDNGKYLSVCFNNRDSHFGKIGERFRTIPKDAKILRGEKIYFSSLDELKELFKDKFEIIESKIIKIGNKKNRVGNFVFMKKASLKKKTPTRKEITGDTKFSELFKNPKAVEILFESGMHCIGCGMAQMETLREGCHAHGFTKKQFEELVKKLNETGK